MDIQEVKLVLTLFLMVSKLTRLFNRTKQSSLLCCFLMWPCLLCREYHLFTDFQLQRLALRGVSPCITVSVKQV